MGNCQRGRHLQHQEIRLLPRDLPRHHLLLHHPPPPVVLHHQPHHPLPPHLLPDRPGLLPAVGLRRENHAMHLRASVTDRLPAAHHRDHPVHVAGHTADRGVPALHHDFRHPVHRHHRVRAERASPVVGHSHHASMGSEAVPIGGATLAVHEASTSWDRACKVGKKEGLLLETTFSPSMVRLFL